MLSGKNCTLINSNDGILLKVVQLCANKIVFQQFDGRSCFFICDISRDYKLQPEKYCGFFDFPIINVV